MKKNEKPKQSRYVKAQDDILSPIPSFDPGLDFSAISDSGVSGFSEAKSIIQRMIAEGYDDIDIIIQLHEELPEDVVQIALRECKKQGIL